MDDFLKPVPLTLPPGIGNEAAMFGKPLADVLHLLQTANPKFHFLSNHEWSSYPYEPGTHTVRLLHDDANNVVRIDRK
jgi:hypothetical protein